MNLIKINHLASQMRDAIEVIPRNKLPLAMASFPHGACGDAALLLGAYFNDCRCFGFKYVCGERGTKKDNSWTSHAWLAKGELVVDISADQFSDAPSKVIVASPSVWHKQFKVSLKESCDFREWSGSGIYDLYSLYSRLNTLLSKKQPPAPYKISPRTLIRLRQKSEIKPDKS